MVTSAIITAYRHPFGVGDPYGDKQSLSFWFNHHPFGDDVQFNLKSSFW
jgi:hypothetical protein